MKAVLLTEPERFEPIDIDEPAEPGDGEAVVRVHRVGVCGTDVAAFRGKMPLLSYPRILGHELGVEVLAVGSAVTNVRVGDRCSVEPYLDCGDCFACRRGRGNCCERLAVLGVHVDGGLRPRFTVPARKLHPSSQLTLEQLALVETLAIGAHAVRRAALSAEATVAVVGAGPIGLSVAAFAHLAGAHVVAIDRDARRLEFCQAALGVPQTLVAESAGRDEASGGDAVRDNADGVAERLRDLLDGELPLLVFDATGNPDSMAAAFSLVAPTGRLVFVGLTGAEITFRPAQTHVREMTLLASRNALPADFAEVIAALESGRLNIDPWLTHRTSLDGFIGDFAALADPAQGVIKALVEVE
ncbi:MAG: hypothetical protein DWQ31_12635 [Planctomycetota bacterium]|nr:MAG: hypothetical protein DWQ31_12635 [Planctomycetota bacterium]REJ95676.1 MAG: hypothetical protein DWQ35_06180 [Planctomycetota bacterium]